VIASLLQSDPGAALFVIAWCAFLILVPLAAAVSVQEHRRVRASNRLRQEQEG
jgi:hypothetical protein